MNFSCPACQAKYFVRDEDVLGRTLKLTCRKCKGGIPIQGRRPGTGEPPSVRPRTISSDRLRLSLSRELSLVSGLVDSAETPPPASLRASMPPRLPDDDGGVDFYVGIGGLPVGPLDAVQLAERAERGEIGPRTYVWRPGQPAWRRLGEVPELSVLFQVLTTPPPMTRQASMSGGSTLEERLGFGYLGGEPALGGRAPAEKHVRLGASAAVAAKNEWTSLFVSLVVSAAVGIVLGTML
jgi:predicted Zn finger-like uncharacterized protein